MRVYDIDVAIRRNILVVRGKVILRHHRLRDRVHVAVVGIVRAEDVTNLDLLGLLSRQPVPGDALAVTPAAAGNRVRVVSGVDCVAC